MMHKKIHEMKDDEIEKADIVVQRTLDRLINLCSNASERAMKALFLINGGGVVTVLTYFNQIKSAPNYWLLSAFIFF